jgi:hypothetical protein
MDKQEVRKRMTILSNALLMADIRAVEAYALADGKALDKRTKTYGALRLIASDVRDARIALADEAERLFGTDLDDEARALWQKEATR